MRQRRSPAVIRAPHVRGVTTSHGQPRTIDARDLDGRQANRRKGAVVWRMVTRVSIVERGAPTGGGPCDRRATAMLLDTKLAHAIDGYEAYFVPRTVAPAARAVLPVQRAGTQAPGSEGGDRDLADS